MNRAALGMFSLLLLLFCLPWSAIALLLLFGIAPYESDGVCYAGRPVWAIAQALVAVGGIALSGKASLAGLATAAQGQRDVGTRWLWLGYAMLAVAAWVLILFALEPDGTRVDTSRCA